MWNNQQIEMELNFFRNELKGIKEKLNKIPMPFKFMYKPPREDSHWNLVEYLDSIDERLRKLEDGITERSISDRSISD